jgi:hypothetical protein
VGRLIDDEDVVLSGQRLRQAESDFSTTDEDDAHRPVIVLK